LRVVGFHKAFQEEIGLLPPGVSHIGPLRFANEWIMEDSKQTLDPRLALGRKGVHGLDRKLRPHLGVILPSPKLFFEDKVSIIALKATVRNHIIF